MNVKVYPANLKGSVNALSSKSEAHRYIIASALSDSPTKIQLNNECEDIKATLQAVKNLGAKYEVENNVYTVYPINREEKIDGVLIDSQESASTLRFLIPIASAITDSVEFDGAPLLRKRPISELLNALKGVGFTSESLPFILRGNLKSGEYRISGKITSQYISGLMFALPLLKGDSKIILTSELQSKSYVDMTIDVLKQFNIEIKEEDYGYYILGEQTYISPKTVAVKGDYSSSSFFFMANKLGGEVAVKGLNKDTVQGDKNIEMLLDKLFKGEMPIDLKNNPDLLPPLAFSACFIKGKATFTGVGRLRLKESNRLEAVYRNIVKMGGNAEIGEDTFTVYGKGELDGGAVIDGFNDHRIIMASVIASCYAKNPTTVLGAESVSKSYPKFFNDVIELGGKIDVL